MEMNGISLSELNEYIERVVALNFEEAVWVQFELSNVKHSRGHVYLEAVEKNEDSDEVTAKISAVIWARAHSFIQKKMKGLEKEIISDGVRILAKVKVDFHPKYGLKLNIEDIDPAFTFGELALEREKTWKRIQTENLHLLNTQLTAPSVVQRIAILSNDTAAGYADFVAQLQANSMGYEFDITLFETAVQGRMVQTDLPGQVDVINEEYLDFDLVVLIRGGGSRLDLQAFDQYAVVTSMAQCKVPVWIGIGHEIDESLCDLVASESFKTPTAVASAIIERNYQFEVGISQLMDSIESMAHQRVRSEDYRMDNIQHLMFESIRQRLRSEEFNLERLNLQTQRLPIDRIQTATMHLMRMEEVVEILDPKQILSKGYAIIEKSDIRITDSNQIQSGDQVRIHLSDTSVEATIN